MLSFYAQDANRLYRIGELLYGAPTPDAALAAHRSLSGLSADVPLVAEEIPAGQEIGVRFADAHDAARALIGTSALVGFQSPVFSGQAVRLVAEARLWAATISPGDSGRINVDVSASQG